MSFGHIDYIMKWPFFSSNSPLIDAITKYNQVLFSAGKFKIKEFSTNYLKPRGQNKITKFYF